MQTVRTGQGNRRPTGLAARRALSAAVLLTAAGVLVGCTAADPNAGSSGSTTADATATPSGTPTVSPSPTPTEPPFGSDVTMVQDGVGTARLTAADSWILANKVDNVYAALIVPPEAPGLGAAQQEQVETWLAAFRTGNATATATVQAPAGGSASAPAGTTTSATTTAATPTSAAQPTADSFRVVSQLLAARSGVSGVRLYSVMTVDGVTTTRWRTFWFDPAVGRVVSGADLFASPRGGAADPLGEARQLVAAAGGDVGSVSDRDLFSSAAFTTDGDLLLYLPTAGGAPAPVTLTDEQVSGLLSEFGKQAQIAARDAVLLPGSSGPTASGPTASGPTSSGPTSAGPTGVGTAGSATSTGSVVPTSPSGTAPAATTSPTEP